MKTSTLTGRALDYAVMLCEFPRNSASFFLSQHVRGGFHYHDDSHADDIIDREKIATGWDVGAQVWVGHVFNHAEMRRICGAIGDTRREAAMRAYAASKLGDEVDIPKELE